MSAKIFLGQLQKESSILKETEKLTFFLNRHFIEVTDHIAKYEDPSNQISVK